MEKDLVKFASARACAAAAAEKANSRPGARPPETRKPAKTTGSRLNRLLGNLERSILAQFGPSSASGSGASSKASRSSSGEKRRAGAQLANSAAAGARLKEEPDRRRGVELQHQQSGNETTTNNAAQSAKMTKSKTTLNKCQQQIVSTLRLPTRHQPNPGQASKQPARLSIPPPHANEEARSQNHRLLFGAGGAFGQTPDAAPAPSPAGSAKSLPAQRKLLPTSALAAQHQNNPTSQSQQGSQLSQQQHPLQHSQQLARSTLAIHNKPPPPPPPLPLSEDHNDDASGFASYQARRQLAGQLPGSQTTTRANQKTSGGEPQPKMIIMQSGQLPALGQGVANFNGPAQNQLQFVSPNNNNNFYQHNFNANPQNNQQLTIQASNQVPIMQPASQPLHLTGFYASQPAARPLSSDFYNLYQQQKLPVAAQHPVGFAGQAQLYQLLPAGEQQQQIYANAPPKPRRYQYYEAPAVTHQNQMVLQQNHAFLHQYRQQSYAFPGAVSGGPLAPKPPLYNNLGYLQHSPLMVQQQQQQFASAGSAFGQLQQPGQQHYFAAAPPALTKSKSSLDIRDLVGYRQQQQLRQNQLLQQHQQNLQQQFGTLRQPQLPLRRNPLYGSQVLSPAEQRAWCAAPPATSAGFNQAAQNQQRQVFQNQQRAAFAKGADLATVISVNENSNSQLIVDLTTPRVLAKTQTRLLSSAGGPASASSWSINQSGLPQMRAPLPAAAAAEQKPAPDPARAKNDLERSAPYYYSDLKSNEQQMALLNIVQQKSLSPPPQLLSRSADLSNTRLTARSATMHASQARDLSESLAAKQLHFNLMQLHQQHQLDQQQQVYQANNNTGILKAAGKATLLQSSPSGSSGNGSNSSADDTTTTASCQEAERPAGPRTSDQLSLEGAGSCKKPEEAPQTNRQLTDEESSFSRLSLSEAELSQQQHHQHEPTQTGKGGAGSAGSHFESVGLGNVIDVDVCSLNNMSQFSPFNSHHLLQHHQSLTILN